MKEVAVVISGGGAKTGFAVGGLEYLHNWLKQHNKRISVVYGTSGGALCAAGYRYGGPQNLKDAWLGIRKKSDVLRFNWKTLLLMSDGIYSLKPLEKHLKKATEGQPIAEAVACKVDITTGELHYDYASRMSLDRFRRGVLASSAIPGIMSHYDGFVDGGVREMVPVKRALEDGWDEVYVFACNPTKKFDIAPQPFKPGNFIENTFRAVDGILEREVYFGDLQFCERNRDKLKIIAPDRLLIDTLEFEPAKIKAVIEHGLARTEDALK